MCTKFYVLLHHSEPKARWCLDCTSAIHPQECSIFSHHRPRDSLQRLFIIVYDNDMAIVATIITSSVVAIVVVTVRVAIMKCNVRVMFSPPVTNARKYLNAAGHGIKNIPVNRTHEYASTDNIS